MAQRKKSVVTPERFAQGLTYDDWLAAIDRNHERFHENYAGVELTEDDASAFRELQAEAPGLRLHLRTE